MKFKIPFALSFSLLCVSENSHAGFLGLTMFSRANCATFNETVSWDATTQWVMDVESWQYHEDSRKKFFFHDYHWISWGAIDPPRNRAYAGCHFCGISGWVVDGYHYLFDTYYDDDPFLLIENCPELVFPGWGEQMVLCKTSYADDCNLTEW